MTTSTERRDFTHGHDKPFTVSLWGSNPDETDNDDCWTGDDFATREEAIKCYREVVMFPDDSQLALACGPRGSWEYVMIDGPETHVGVVMEKLGPRRSEMSEMRNPGQGMVRLTFRIPARGLFGYRSEFLTDTRGTGIMHHRFLDYGPWAGPLAGRKRGVLVADREGNVVAFALGNLQERAQMFVTPGDLVYEGMIAGENSRPGDLDVNVTKEKKLTNMRTTASDENVILEPPRQITLEYALEYIDEDELIEITPKTIRLRKRVLTANDRKKAARAARVADAS